MKTIMKYTLVLLAGLSLSLSCSKIDEKNDVMNPHDEDVATTVEGKQISICAKFPDAVTRVEYALDETGSKPKLTLSWENTDVLVVSNASSSVELENPTIDETGKTATFTGVLPEGGAPYKVSVKHAGSNMGATQTQASDGDLTHLEYAAMAENVTEEDFDDLVLSQTTGVLGLIAKIPTDVSANVKAVIFQTENNLFNDSNTLTVKLTTPGAGTDNILYAYANVAARTIPAGTEMFIRFKVGDGDYDYYTRYQKFDAAVSLANGALNGLKLNCSHIDRYAGKDDDGTSESTAYLIGDKYQLIAMHSTMADNATTYYRLIDDIDFGNGNWESLNQTNGYGSRRVYFDGANHTIKRATGGSNKRGAFFYVLGGTVKDLKLEQFDINCGSGQGGILASYIQAADTEVSNVDITQSSVTSDNNTGALVGRINNAGTSASITGCDITETKVKGSCAGGLIGSVEVPVTVSECTYTGKYDGTPAIDKIVDDNKDIWGTSNYTGGIVGHIASNASFDHCTVENACIYGVNYTGGFVGDVSFANPVSAKKIDLTYNTIKGTTGVNGNSAVGGFAGYICTSGDCQDNTTNATVLIRNNNGGGFVGTVDGNSRLDHNTATGNVTANHNESDNPNAHGGFVGNDISGSYSYCKSMGPVQSSGYAVGGFVGLSAGASTYSHCRVQTSSVQSTYSNTASGSKNGCVGGFAGLVNTFTGTFEYCWMSNAGSVTKITAKKQRVGGFVGQIGSSTANNNTGIFHYCRVHRAQLNSAPQNSGLFAGVSYIAMDQCCASTSQNSTILNGASNIGGFVGYQQGKTLSNCYVQGNFTLSVADGGTAQKVGGFVGHAQNTTISNCFTNAAIGSVGSITQIGSFIADGNNTNLYIENCLSTYSADFAYNNLYLSTGGHNAVVASNSIASTAQSSDYNWSSEIWNFGNPPSLINCNADPFSF